MQLISFAAMDTFSNFNQNTILVTVVHLLRVVL